MIKQVLRGVLTLGVFSAAASADIFNEVGDAGQLVGTAQDVTGVSPLTQIRGEIADEDDIDVYRILITDYANFSADTIGSQLLSGVDTQLFLFDQNGFGIYGNDDRVAGVRDSILPAGHASGPMSNGIYLLAVSSYDNDPISAGGGIFNGLSLDILTPTGPGGASSLIGWNDGADDEYGEYVINLNLNGATVVPAPGAVVLAMLGMPAIGWIRRRFAA